MLKSYLLILFLFFTSQFYEEVAAQTNFTIEGRILDLKTEEPISGVSIRVKESIKSSSVMTGSQGSFRIRLHQGQTLVISHLNYMPQEIQVRSGQSNLVIRLAEDPHMLSEVNVTGALGIKRQARELGTSAQSVDNQELNLGKVVNPLLALSSKVAGLRINATDLTTGKTDPGIQIRLRGTRSLNRSKNDPIYVVDGVPLPDITRINPNDIQDITVLKGANAAALYGSEGVNGAIMITTKSGRAERGQINYSNSTLFSKVFLLPPAQQRFGQGQNGVYSPVANESWGDRFNGEVRDFGLPINGVQPTKVYSAPDKDNRLDFFDTGVTVQNDLSFSSGDDKGSYYVSLQDVRIKGVIPGDKSSRTGVRFNGSRRFNKLNSSFNTNYVFFKNNTTSDGPWLSVYTQPANIDYKDARNWQDPSSPNHPLNWYNPVAGTRNPIFMADNNRNTSDQHTLNSKLEFNYEFTDWLDATFRTGLYFQSEPGRVTNRKLVSNIATRNINGSVNDTHRVFTRFNNDLILNFHKNFGDFSTKFLVGQNVRMDDTKSINISATNLLFEDIFNQGSRTGELVGGSTITKYRSLATYGEFTAGYKNYLFLTFTGRNDQVSVLDPGNNSYFSPGVSSSFVFTDAIASLQKSRVLSYGRIFTSFNKTGNVTLDPYRLNLSYSQTAGFPFGSLVGFTPSLSEPNRSIKPEFVKSFEVGTQLGFFNDRLRTDIVYAYSDSDGQIFDAGISRATGFNSTIVNAGQIINKTYEIMINGTAIKSKDLNLQFGLNFSYTDTKAKNLYAGDEFNIFRQAYAIKGLQYPTLRMTDFLREDGKIVLDPNGNVIPSEEEKVMGTMVPPYLFGFNTKFNYKSFTMGFQIDARLGSWMYSEVIPRMFAAGTHPETAKYDRQPFIMPNSMVRLADGSIVENNEVYSKGDKAWWTAYGNIQSVTAAKGDYLKLRELYIGYDLPQSWLSQQRMIKKASIGFVGNNLFIVRHSSNTIGDPEALYNQTDGYNSFRQIPTSRSMGFNVNITF
ncbi:SusC/RagA family TonB-linked outer membrane protein [Sphingobacterium paramultivorum]|uniref:SusC/RagA family TonB-linked outer membrane protein n=1 Tax=Sphingobacterium paramultivorum TaxID=2886510 RepID=A0A7G5DWU4_9SPHI|nr:SusC/RagA family TonB-linked outer membrane protein [Sphingobacterium paramultivorum]QMV66219.1 SusC/RagA family TonB-linked outer membrane protein [Sphingobacterium paramultivorum]WSO14995.1 SusC/RagA family TonB-linked outer membrane protein [Sphingobacterium paramultivorum]